jgi:hypothetical protein
MLTFDLRFKMKTIEINTNKKTLFDLLLMIKMYGDNQGPIKLIKNIVFHTCTKHIEIHHHFIQEKIVG